MLGVKVKIFSNELPDGKGKKPLPDAVFIVELKEIDAQGVGEPRSIDVNPHPVDPVAPPPEQQGLDQGEYQQGRYPQGGF